MKAAQKKRVTKPLSWQEVHVLCSASGMVAAIFESGRDALRAKKEERKLDSCCYLERWRVHPVETETGAEICSTRKKRR